MARARNIKPSIFMNEILGIEDPLYTILFEGLWCIADREGRLEDRPLRIKAQVFPYREGLDVNEMLNWLEVNSFIKRYEAAGKRYIFVTNFLKHQNPHHTEKNSVIPDISERTVNSPLNNGAAPADSGLLITDSGLLIEGDPPPVKAPEKIVYADDVRMTEGEYEKLGALLGEDKAQDYIGRLSLYKGSLGKEKKYRDDYKTILIWHRRDQDKAAARQPRGSPRAGHDTDDVVRARYERSGISLAASGIRRAEVVVCDNG